MPNNILMPTCLRTALAACLAAAATLSSPSDASSGESPSDLFGTMYWTHRDEGVYFAARDGSDVKMLAPGKFADGLAVDIQNGTLYWTISSSPSKIQKANLDGTGVEDVVTDLTGTGDLALDAEAGKLYVSLMNEGKIVEINTDGSERHDFATGLNAPDELAFDAKQQTLYCTCSGDNTIQQIKLTDRKPRAILTSDGTWFGLAIDPTAEQLYCVQVSRGAIYHAKLDGWVGASVHHG